MLSESTFNLYNEFGIQCLKNEYYEDCVITTIQRKGNFIPIGLLMKKSKESNISNISTDVWKLEIGGKVTFDIKYNFSDYLDNNPTIIGVKIDKNTILIEDIIKDTVEYGTLRYSMLGIREGSYITISELNIRDKIDIELFKQNIDKGNILLNDTDIDELNLNELFSFTLNKKIFNAKKITDTLLRVVE